MAPDQWLRATPEVFTTFVRLITRVEDGRATREEVAALRTCAGLARTRAGAIMEGPVLQPPPLPSVQLGCEDVCADAHRRHFAEQERQMRHEQLLELAARADAALAREGDAVVSERPLPAA